MASRGPKTVRQPRRKEPSPAVWPIVDEYTPGGPSQQQALGNVLWRLNEIADERAAKAAEVETP